MSSLDNALDAIIGDVEALQQKAPKRSLLLPKETNGEFVEELTNDDDEEREEIRQAAREDEDRRRAEIEAAEAAASAQTKRQAYKQLTNLSPAEIEEHYNRCIQLCNQNKVNKSNAFKLQLIDCMKMIMEQPKNTSNLTLAGCTLDASAKIYACRVDSVYSDMLMALSGDRKATTDDSSPSDEEEGGGNEAENDDEPKRKKKRKGDSEDLDFEKFLMSEDDLKKDRRKRDEDDAFLLKGRSVLPPGVDNFVECPLFGPLSELKLDCRLDYYDDDSTFSQSNPITTITKITEYTPVDPAKYIPGYKDLRSKFHVIGGDDCAEESTPRVPANLIDKALIFEPVENALSNHATFVDEDDTAVGVDDYELDYDACDYQEDSSCPPQSSTSGSAIGRPGSSLHTTLSHKERSQQFGVGGLSRFVSISPSDYSYFDDAKAKFHAAPSHWSLKPKKIRLDKFIPGATTQKKAAAKRKQHLIDFSADRLGDVKKEFLTKEAPCLAQKTMQSWEKDKRKFAYCSFNAKKLLSFFTNDDLLFVDKDLKKRILPVGDDDIEDPQAGRSLVPDAPHESDSDDDREEFGSCGDPASPIREIGSRLSQRLSAVGFEAEPFASCGGLDELVPAPPRVEQIQVNYARIQKRVDIRGLKNAIWNFLDLEKDKENINVEQPASNDEPPKSVVRFSQVVNSVPKRIAPDEASQLSVPIMFMAVLHLANEKNLKFTQWDKSEEKVAGDFKIALNDK